MDMEFVVHCVSLALFLFTGAVFVLCHESGESHSDGNGFGDADERSVIITD